MAKFLRQKKDINDITVKRLKSTADFIDMEQRVFEACQGDSKGISLEETFQLLYRIRNLRKKYLHFDFKRIHSLGDEDSRRTNEYILFPKTKKELVKEIVSFLKTIDNDLYLRTLKILVTPDDEDISLNHYYKKNDYGKEYEQYFQRKTPLSIYRHGKRMVYPGILSKESTSILRAINEVTSLDEFCTYDDMSMCLHEIAHGFDLDLYKDRLYDFYNTNNGRNNTNQRFKNNVEAMVEQLIKERDGLGKKDITVSRDDVVGIFDANREFLSETTSIFFEYLFAEYLRKLGKASDRTIYQANRRREKNIAGDIDLVAFYARIGIDKRKGMKLDKEYFLKFNEIDPTAIDKMERLRREPFISFHRRYVLADLFVPSMIEMYMQDEELGKERLRNYLECARNWDVDGALAAFEIDVHSKQGQDKLVANYEQNLRRLFPECFKAHEEDER